MILIGYWELGIEAIMPIYLNAMWSIAVFYLYVYLWSLLLPLLACITYDLTTVVWMFGSNRFLSNMSTSVNWTELPSPNFIAFAAIASALGLRFIKSPTAKPTVNKITKINDDPTIIFFLLCFKHDFNYLFSLILC